MDFVIKFAFNSMLDNKDHPLVNFPPLIKFVIYLSRQRKFPRFIKSFDSKKAARPDKTPLVVIKNIRIVLTQILEKLFNLRLKEKCFMCQWNISAVRAILRIQMRILTRLNIDASIFLVSSANHFYGIDKLVISQIRI